MCYIKNLFVFHLNLNKLRDFVVVLYLYNNFTKFHENLMKTKKFYTQFIFNGWSIPLELVNFALNKMSQKYKNMFQFEVDCGGTA